MAEEERDFTKGSERQIQGMQCMLLENKEGIDHCLGGRTKRCCHNNLSRRAAMLERDEIWINCL